MKQFLLFIIILIIPSISLWSQGLKTPSDTLQEKKEASLKHENIKEAHMFRELYRNGDTLVSRLISSYYDKNGNKTKVQAGDKNLTHNELKYNEDDQLIQIQFYRNDSLNGYVKYRWENDKIVEEKHFHKDTLWSVSEYHYFEEADTSFSVMIRNKKDTVRIEKLYPEDEQLIVYENLSYPDSRKNYQKWFYNSTGNIVKEININHSRPGQKKIITWYEGGNAVKQKQGKMIHNFKSHFENDLVMESISFDEDGKKVTRMYMEYVQWD